MMKLQLYHTHEISQSKTHACIHEHLTSVTISSSYYHTHNKQYVYHLQSNCHVTHVYGTHALLEMLPHFRSYIH